MKTCVVIFFALVATSYQKKFSEVSDHYQEIVEKAQPCYQEVPIERSLILNALDNGEFVDDRDLKCFIRCVHKKLHIMDEDDNIDADVLKDYIGVHDETAEIVMDKCKDVKGKDGCETSFDISVCIYFSIQEILKGDTV